MVFHKLYGLLVASDEALPGLPLVSEPEREADVQVHLKSCPFPFSAFDSSFDFFYVSRTKDGAGNPVLRGALSANLDYLSFRYCDGTHFAIDLRGSRIFVDWPDLLTLEDAAAYLAGPILGIVLRLRGVFPLHASAVAVGDCAIALAGPAGAGKSTTAAALASCGYRVLSDDVVALQERRMRFFIPPGYPRLNLWSESIHAIVGQEGAATRICPTSDKCFMPLDPATQFESKCLPIGAIYVLQRRDPGSLATTIQSLTGSEAFIAVLGNTYMNYLPDPEKRRQEFDLLGRLVRQVPIRAVHRPADLSRLSDLCAAITKDVTTVPGGSSVPVSGGVVPTGSFSTEP